MTKYFLIAFAIGLVIIGFVAAYKNGPSEEEAAARLAIDACWKEHDRKSLAPDQKRFIAGSCEKMQDKFSKQYGKPL